MLIQLRRVEADVSFDCVFGGVLVIDGSYSVDAEARGRHHLKVNITETDWQFDRDERYGEYSQEGEHQILMLSNYDGIQNTVAMELHGC